MICTYKYCSCCCCKPRTATLTFGILGLVVSILNALSFLVFCCLGDPLMMATETSQVLMVICSNLYYMDKDSFCSDIILENYHFLISTKVYVAFNYVVTFVYLCNCSLLLIGVRDERKELLLPYIWSNVCLILSYLVIWGVGWYYLTTLTIMVFSTFAILPVIAVCILGEICVEVYYKELKKKDLVEKMKIVERLNFPVVTESEINKIVKKYKKEHPNE